MAKKKRLVNLKRRTAQVTNLNFKPELHGETLERRADLSLSFLLADDEIDELVLTRTNPLNVLWDKQGEPQLLELGKLQLDLIVSGKAELGFLHTEDRLLFDGAKLKKVVVDPMIGRQVTVTCQLRVDPTDHLDELGDMVIDKGCTFSFVGDGAPESEKNDDQGQLSV